MSKNLNTHLNKLFSEIQSQKELLYNADYQIQLLERKLARSMGEKTLEETDFLKEIIKMKEKETELSKKKLNDTLAACKTLEDDQRLLDKKLKVLEEEEYKFKTALEKINLENDMTKQQLYQLVSQKKQVMVKNDITKLEIQKLTQKVLESNEDVLSLDNQ